MIRIILALGLTVTAGISGREYMEGNDSMDQKVPPGLQGNIVLYYSFQRTEGARVPDISGNRNHGTIRGASHTSDRRGEGYLSLDGKDDSVGIPGIHLESFTFSTLVMIQDESLDLKGRCLFLLDGDKGYYTLQGGDSGALEFVSLIHGMGGELSDRGGWPGPGRWIPIAVTFDGSRIRLYRNGKITGEGMARGDDVAGIAHIGGTDRQVGRFWPGNLDEVALFNRALTPEEIDVLHRITATLHQEPPRPDVVLHYSFHEDPGDLVLDLSGQNHHGRVFGARYEAGGRFGGALLFDGEDDFLRVPNVHLENFTFCAHVKTLLPPGKRNTNNRRLFLLHDGPRYYALQGNSAGSIGMEFTGHRGVNEYDWQLEADRWTHIAITYERPRVKIFKNGRVTAEGSIDAEGVTGTLYLGGTDRHYGRFWHGWMDEVLLLNRALEEEEIEEIYRATSRPSGDHPGLTPEPQARSGEVSASEEVSLKKTGFSGRWCGLSIDKPGEGTSVDPLTLELKSSSGGGVEGTAFWLSNSLRCQLEKVRVEGSRLRFEFLHRSGGRMGVTLQLKEGQLVGEAVPMQQREGDRCDLLLQRPERKGIEGPWFGLAIDKPGEGTSRDPLALELKRSEGGRLEGSAHGWFVRSCRCDLENIQVQGEKIQFQVIHRTGARMNVTLQLKDGHLQGEGIPIPEGDRCDILLARPGGSRPGGESPLNAYFGPGGG